MGVLSGTPICCLWEVSMNRLTLVGQPIELRLKFYASAVLGCMQTIELMESGEYPKLYSVHCGNFADDLKSSIENLLHTISEYNMICCTPDDLESYCASVYQNLDATQELIDLLVKNNHIK